MISRREFALILSGLALGGMSGCSGNTLTSSTSNASNMNSSNSSNNARLFDSTAQARYVATRICGYDKDGNWTSTESYEHDSQGRVIKSNTESAKGSDSSYTYTYDEQGNCVYQFGESKRYDTITSKDHDGRTLQLTFKWEGGSESVNEYTYDENGLISTFKNTSSDGKVGTETYINGLISHKSNIGGMNADFTYEKDSSGLITTMNYKYQRTSNGQSVGDPTTIIYKYEYDSEGKPIKRTTDTGAYTTYEWTEVATPAPDVAAYPSFSEAY